MRSSVGVGITPPNVDGAPKPTSSVRISRILGAPLWRNHPCRPRRLGLRSVEADITLEGLRRRRQVTSIDCRGCGGRTRRAGGLLGVAGCAERENESGAEHSAQREVFANSRHFDHLAPLVLADCSISVKSNPIRL